MRRIYEAHVESDRPVGAARRFVAHSDAEAVRQAIGGLATGQTVALWREGHLLGRLSAPVTPMPTRGSRPSLPMSWSVPFGA